MSSHQNQPQQPERPGILLDARLVFALAITIALIVGSTLGVPMALIFLAACALCATIFLVWSSLQVVSDPEHMDFEEALSLAAPTATHEQKLAVLRALKDLEYEWSVGKIEPADYEQAKADYRAEAKRLIAAQDSELEARMDAASKRVEDYLTTHDSAGPGPRVAKGGA